MGIKNIADLLKKECPNCYSEVPISDFYGKRIAIDTSNWLHCLWATSYKEVINMTDVCVNEPDKNEVIKVWLRGTEKFINKFLNNGIIPIFIFDGKAPIEKVNTK